MTKIVG